MRRIALFVCVAALGCAGGETPAASSPESSETPDEPSAAGDPENTEAAAEKSEPSGGDDGGKDTAPGAEDVRAVLQLVIDDESLGPFLHLDQPGRFPLQISGSNLPDGLTKSNEPVKIVQGRGSKKDAVLAITEIDIKGKHAVVRYRYDIEGVQGSAVLDKREHGWELTRSKVVER
jgi:hypothetical protein